MQVFVFHASLWAMGQTLAYKFDYREKVRADYSSLLSSGKSSQLVSTNATQTGAFKIQYLEDNIFLGTIFPDTFDIPFAPFSEVNPVLRFKFLIDEHGVISKIWTTPEAKMQMEWHKNWLLELPFQLPKLNSFFVEEKQDGRFSVQYTQENTVMQKIMVQKSTPQFLSDGSKQYVDYLKFDWQASFSSPKKQLQAIEFVEEKKQYIARKILAEIERQLHFCLLELDTFSTNDVADKSMDTELKMSNKLSTEDRRYAISSANLKSCDVACLTNEMAQLDTTNSNTIFKLKSKLRSYFILHPTDSLPYVLLNTFVGLSFKEQMIMAALIESKTAMAEQFALQYITKNKSNYEELKMMSIWISLYELNTEPIVKSYSHLLRSSQSQIKQMAELTIANLLLAHKESSFYGSMTNLLLKPYINGKTAIDTAQYLNLVRNAGIAAEFKRLKLMAYSTSSFSTDAFLALKNINTTETSLFLTTAYKAGKISPTNLAFLFEDRQMPKELSQILVEDIIAADRQNEENNLPLLKLILDRKWIDHIDTSLFETHTWQTRAYLGEWQDFKKVATFQ